MTSAIIALLALLTIFLVACVFAVAVVELRRFTASGEAAARAPGAEGREQVLLQ